LAGHPGRTGATRGGRRRLAQCTVETVHQVEHLPSAQNREMIDCSALSGSVPILDAGTMTTFRCYAYASGGSWHGICTDLDIAVDGASYQEVEESLGICIRMYLESISELPEGERRQLLTRRAPWHLRARLAVSTWAHRLKLASDRHSRSFFLESHVVAPS